MSLYIYWNKMCFDKTKYADFEEAYKTIMTKHKS